MRAASAGWAPIPRLGRGSPRSARLLWPWTSSTSTRWCAQAQARAYAHAYAHVFASGRRRHSDRLRLSPRLASPRLAHLLIGDALGSHATFSSASPGPRLPLFASITCSGRGRYLFAAMATEQSRSSNTSMPSISMATLLGLRRVRRRPTTADFAAFARYCSHPLSPPPLPRAALPPPSCPPTCQHAVTSHSCCWAVRAASIPSDWIHLHNITSRIAQTTVDASAQHAPLLRCRHANDSLVAARLLDQWIAAGSAQPRAQPSRWLRRQVALPPQQRLDPPGWLFCGVTCDAGPARCQTEWSDLRRRR